MTESKWSGPAKSSKDGFEGVLESWVIGRSVIMQERVVFLGQSSLVEENN